MNTLSKWLLGAAVLLTGNFQARTADHMNLEENLPLQVEDAYPIAHRGREVQAIFRYDYTRENEDKLLLEPQIELGLLPNTELSISSPFFLGEADQRGRGDIEIAGLYNFNTEGLFLPALALEAQGTIPTGVSSDGFDTALKFIATKSISRMGTDRLHLNLAWLHNAAPLADEREHRYAAVLGYSRRLAADWVLVADFVRQTDRIEHEDSNILELGFRWQVTPLTVVSFGAGAGIGRESPKARAVLGFQKSF